MQTWLSRCLAGLFLIVMGVSLSRASTIQAVELGPQQQVRTINPKMGVHTRLTDEVEPWKIKYTLQMVREMGSPWIVEYFPWAYHEPWPGLFDWSHSDLVVDHANRQGLTVIARLGFVPEWARPPETTASFLARERFSDFGDYVYAFVKRYRGRVNHIVIWNEPNLALEWGFQPLDPEGYTALLEVAYRRAKEADPAVQVLGGALAPTLAPVGSEWGMNDLTYLQRMYAAGAAEVMDGLAVHAYGWVYPAGDPPDPEVVNFRRVELARQIMEANGHGAALIYITEGGWNDHPRWTRAVKPGQRIEYSLEAFDLARRWPWLASMALWAFRYPWPARTYLDYYTFVSTDFEPKPIYLELRRYARGD